MALNFTFTLFALLKWLYRVTRKGVLLFFTHTKILPGKTVNEELNALLTHL